MESLVAIMIAGFGLAALALPQIIRDHRERRERRARSSE